MVAALVTDGNTRIEIRLHIEHGSARVRKR
jgi:hypothetical protein